MNKEEYERYVVERTKQFNEYDALANKEFEELKEKYLKSAENDQTLFVAAVAFFVLFACAGGIMNIHDIGPCVNWLGAAGALGTLWGIYLQLHYFKQGNIVKDLSEVSAEREDRFAVFYTFRQVSSLCTDSKISKAEEDEIMTNLYKDERLTLIRGLRESIQGKQSNAAYIFIVLGTLVWAFTWRTCV